MTRAQIQCFLTVVEKMSITEAAKVLYVSQPAVSRRIAQLEEELETKLFARDNTRLILTPEGRKAADLFREYENKIADFIMESKQKSANSSLQGVVRIGVADGWDISEWFSKVSKQVKELYPDIQLMLYCSGHEELFHMMERKEVDLVLDQRELFSGLHGIRTNPLRKVKCILMYAAKHPLAGKENLCLEDFKDSVFYVAVSKKGEKLILDMIQACIEVGFLPEIEYVGTLSATYVKMLSEHGVFVADELLLAKDQPMFRNIELNLERTLSLGSRTNQNRVCQIVEDIILDHKEYFV